MTNNSLTQDQLKERLIYNRETGVFTRAKAVGHNGNWKEGLEVGYVSSSDGYIYISIQPYGKFSAHRLAWLYVTGEMPNDEIDHINHIKTDNRFKNLRSVSHKDNGRNTSKPSNNTSGVVGFSWRKDRGKWQCHIKVNGKKLSLGCYACIKEAAKVRKDAELKYGFHKNHGV